MKNIRLIMCIALLSSVGVFAQKVELTPEDSINGYLQSRQLAFKSTQAKRLIKGVAYSGFALTLGGDLGPGAMFSAFNFYSYFTAKQYVSPLQDITNDNFETKIPELRESLHKKRVRGAAISLGMGSWLVISLLSGKIPEDTQTLLTSVASDVIASSIVRLRFKSADEQFLEKLEEKELKK
ncbi:hypothetical protein OAJ27_00450 [bacterium]|nr:hypothetical protein [bacterium]